MFVEIKIKFYENSRKMHPHPEKKKINKNNIKLLRRNVMGPIVKFCLENQKTGKETSQQFMEKKYGILSITSIS